MSARRFGIGLRGNLGAGEYGKLGRLAEELGFDVVSVFNDLGDQPALPALLEVAAATDRVMVGPACLNPFTLHPVEIAGQVTSLDAASAGRAYLGLAKGAWLSSIGIAQARPVRSLREAVRVVRALLADDRSGYRGEVFRLEPGVHLDFDVVRAGVPLLIGGWGERTVALAGEIADELKVGGSANPELVPVMRSRLAAGEVRAGRRSMPAGIVLGAVTVVDEDGEAARESARSAVAAYFEVVAGLDPTIDLPRGLVESMSRLLQAGDRGAAGRLIPEHLLDRFAFCGTPNQVARRVRDIFDAGAARVEFGSPFGLDPESGLRLLGERVLPQFH
ncbi:MAG TPA: LLM class flavin-dependent oxidoreductase [Candidatus Saccharimonadales bacterium]|nr:LLM class flavin-dependent oxidoreductase [Candidatus Saccharimonadales bacterium]